MNYDVAQAERAEVWIKYGDWTFKGADPTLELSDFLPSEEQYAAAFTKAHARYIKNELYVPPTPKKGAVKIDDDEELIKRLFELEKKFTAPLKGLDFLDKRRHKSQRKANG